MVVIGFERFRIGVFPFCGNEEALIPLTSHQTLILIKNRYSDLRNSLIDL